MIKAKQIPTEVLAVFEKACDSGEPWNIADTIAAAINAWPGMDYQPGAMVTKTWRDPGKITLPLPKERLE